ncbi:F-box only protein 47-like [Glandiceps talaboti]
MTTSLLKTESRRSKRLRLKEEAFLSYQSVQEGPLGYFEILPLEVIDYILDKLTVVDLSVLSIVSKCMCELIERQQLTGSAVYKLLPTPLPHNTVSNHHQSRCIERFHHLGLLLKRSTCLYTTKDRLRIIEKFLKKLDCCNSSACVDSHRCISLTCYGRFIHTVIAGWDCMECHRVFASLAATSSILHKIGLCVIMKPGSNLQEECYIRDFLHRVLLDQCTDMDDRAFWLSRVLKPWPMVHQARILYLLYGPKCSRTDCILWYDMTDTLPDSVTSREVQLAELAMSLKILYNYRQEWNEDDITSVIEELTALPDEWIPENTAALLMLCGEVICTKVMGSKAINGHFIELAQLIVSLTVVITKGNYCIVWVLNLLKKLLTLIESPKEKKVFLATIGDTFRELILELVDFHDDDTEDSTSLHQLLDAQADFNREVLLLSFM